MKKTGVFVFFIFLAQLSISQITPWINQGAIWNYRGDGGFAQVYCQIEYTGDTLFNGRNCQKLMAKYDTYTASPPIGLVNTFTTGPHLTYNNGDTVFYFQNNQFSILYNFASQAGETWNLGIDTNSNYCSKSIVVVDSTSIMSINSNNHRILFVSDSTHSSVGIQGKIIEHIGSSTFLFPTEKICDSIPPVVEWVYYSLICFHDDSVSYYLVPNNLCQSPLTSMNETLLNELSIVAFPNPATNYLKIIFNQQDYYSISIFNPIGELMFKTNNNKNKEFTMNGLKLKKGFYFILFENSNREQLCKKIMIE
jgi:hypothetical protein